jgi:hypothetical protein
MFSALHWMSYLQQRRWRRRRRRRRRSLKF